MIQRFKFHRASILTSAALVEFEGVELVMIDGFSAGS